MRIVRIRPLLALLLGAGVWTAAALDGYATDYSSALISAAAEPESTGSDTSETPVSANAARPKLAHHSDEYAQPAVNIEVVEEPALELPPSQTTSVRTHAAPSASYAPQATRQAEPNRGAAMHTRSAPQTSRYPSYTTGQNTRPVSTGNTAYSYSQSAITSSMPNHAMPSAQRPTQRMAMTVPSTTKANNYYLPSSRVVRQTDVPTEAVGPETVSPGSIDPGSSFSSSSHEYMPFEPTWNGSMMDMSRGVFFGGAEFLLIRPRFSENTAYLVNTVSADPQGNVTIQDEIVEQDFGYNGSVRAFVGYRLPDCCGELRFTYWNYGNSSSLLTPPGTPTTTYVGHLEVLTRIPGERLGVDSSLNVNVYDIDYGKCICYNGCCDPCNYCPPWGLKYYAGVRIADIQRQDDNQLFGVDGDVNQSSAISGDFIGAGPRVGLEGRRWFRGGRGSLFARGNFALLLGQYDIDMTRFTPGVVDLTERYLDSHARIIPVGEIELGGNYQLTQRVNLGLGYLFQSWWDLGAFEQIQGNVFRGPVDDGNIMSFDGFFARLEVCF